MSEEDAVGRECITEDILTPSLIERYQATVGKSHTGEQAPLGIHWCLCLPNADLSKLGPDGHPLQGDFLPHIDLPRRMWASSDVTFQAPLKVGDRVSRLSRIDSVERKTGSSGELVFVNVRHLTRVKELVCVDEVQTIVYRGAAGNPATLPAASGVVPEVCLGIEKIQPTPQMLFRYSALTFNTHRIHYDKDYASDVEGYPDLVVQGPLMASLLLRFASNCMGADKINRFSFRATAPAFCAQDLFLRYDASAPNGEQQFSVLRADGHIAVKASIQ